jgi:hypothetical protein
MSLPAAGGRQANAGVLVVIEACQHLDELARQFAGNSMALVAFFTAYWVLQDHDRLLAMTGAWPSPPPQRCCTSPENSATRQNGQQIRVHEPDPSFGRADYGSSLA